MLSQAERLAVAKALSELKPRFPKLLTNYSSDLKTLVEPCVFGGTPDCSQCGCVASSGLHWLKSIELARLVKIGTLVNASIGVGAVLGKFRREYQSHARWA